MSITLNYIITKILNYIIYDERILFKRYVKKKYSNTPNQYVMDINDLMEFIGKFRCVSKSWSGVLKILDYPYVRIEYDIDINYRYIQTLVNKHSFLNLDKIIINNLYYEEYTLPKESSIHLIDISETTKSKVFNLQTFLCSYPQSNVENTTKLSLWCPDYDTKMLSLQSDTISPTQCLIQLMNRSSASKMPFSTFHNFTRLKSIVWVQFDTEELLPALHGNQTIKSLNLNGSLVDVGILVQMLNSNNCIQSLVLPVTVINFKEDYVINNSTLTSLNINDTYVLSIFNPIMSLKSVHLRSIHQRSSLNNPNIKKLTIPGCQLPYNILQCVQVFKMLNIDISRGFDQIPFKTYNNVSKLQLKFTNNFKYVDQKVLYMDSVQSKILTLILSNENSIKFFKLTYHGESGHLFHYILNKLNDYHSTPTELSKLNNMNRCITQMSHDTSFSSHYCINDHVVFCSKKCYTTESTNIHTIKLRKHQY
ncbi:hypothetical protein DLAC_09215 [Tieghemostelium lacteum]|uniref:Uncharacterized protein n=1 Tax=Tieghemostelium lacteum TaxID=361077 RepID=A0A151Z9G6_TIELA|nr:hypothetical protein DLAC_09215 [Tieghemostelium lacteum]|eukprot:KYQ90585.1 hypothetical protein DLAC_09215 [Tieghemostelium lacteum]